MTKYYLAWYNITDTNTLNYDKHLYMVRDDNGDLSDTDDQFIVRSGYSGNTVFTETFGDVVSNDLAVESGEVSEDSLDGLDNTDVDRDQDGGDNDVACISNSEATHDIARFCAINNQSSGLDAQTLYDNGNVIA